MNIRQRIRILLNELKKKEKDVAVATIYMIKIDGVWENVDSEYSVFERLMEEWGKD